MEHIAVSGLYPCGEGSGYAGGIVSSAVDGIKAAEAISRKLFALHSEPSSFAKASEDT